MSTPSPAKENSKGTSTWVVLLLVFVVSTVLLGLQSRFGLNPTAGIICYAICLVLLVFTQAFLRRRFWAADSLRKRSIKAGGCALALFLAAIVAGMLLSQPISYAAGYWCGFFGLAAR
jgi:hypothetical protein